MSTFTACQRSSAINNRAFDLDAYCARINYKSSREVSAQTLRALHFAHVHNVPFENLDIHLGKPLSLEPADLFSKIVTHKRGGYCYEVNSFFTMILRAFGFQVQGLLARVLYSFSDFRPRSHQLLLVTVDNESRIADVGFGSCSCVSRCGSRRASSTSKVLTVFASELSLAPRIYWRHF